MLLLIASLIKIVHHDAVWSFNHASNPWEAQTVLPVDFFASSLREKSWVHEYLEVGRVEELVLGNLDFVSFVLWHGCVFLSLERMWVQPSLFLIDAAGTIKKIFVHDECRAWNSDLVCRK